MSSALHILFIPSWRAESLIICGREEGKKKEQTNTTSSTFLRLSHWQHKDTMITTETNIQQSDTSLYHDMRWRNSEHSSTSKEFLLTHYTQTSCVSCNNNERKEEETIRKHWEKRGAKSHHLKDTQEKDYECDEERRLLEWRTSLRHLDGRSQTKLFFVLKRHCSELEWKTSRFASK